MRNTTQYWQNTPEKNHHASFSKQKGHNLSVNRFNNVKNSLLLSSISLMSQMTTENFKFDIKELGVGL